MFLAFKSRVVFCNETNTSSNFAHSFQIKATNSYKKVFFVFCLKLRPTHRKNKNNCVCFYHQHSDRTTSWLHLKQFKSFRDLKASFLFLMPSLSSHFSHLCTVIPSSLAWLPSPLATGRKQQQAASWSEEKTIGLRRSNSKHLSAASFFTSCFIVDTQINVPPELSHHLNTHQQTIDKSPCFSVKTPGLSRPKLFFHS